jgi:hypothetical protein
VSQGRRDLSKSSAYLITAGILIPIVAILVPLLVSRHTGDEPSGATPTVATSRPSAASANSGADQPPAKPAAGVAQATPVVLWTHGVTFPSGQQGLRLADGRPRVTDVGTDFRTATWGDGRPGFEKDSGTAGTVTKADPNVSECQNALISDAQSYSISTDVGSSVCFLSADERFLAAVTVTAWDPSNEKTSANVTVWRLSA